jgi:predicted amidophosphoribosyltransferase
MKWSRDLLKNRCAPLCSACGAEVFEASPLAMSVICATCTTGLASKWARQGKEGSGKRCPDCDEPVQKFKRFCPKCAKKRRRTTLRAARNRSRQNAARKSL